MQKRKVKKLNTFVANLPEFCPNFLKRPVPPRLLQKVWDFFVMMIDVEGKAISEALSGKKLKYTKMLIGWDDAATFKNDVRNSTAVCQKFFRKRCNHFYHLFRNMLPPFPRRILQFFGMIRFFHDFGYYKYYNLLQVPNYPDFW